MKIIIITRNVINKDDFESIKDRSVTITVPPLEEYEAIDFIVNNCNRDIADDLIRLNLNNYSSVNDYLSAYLKIKKCDRSPN
jgi:hypothetical protein